jgi:hypothetical protein
MTNFAEARGGNRRPAKAATIALQADDGDALPWPDARAHSVRNPRTGQRKMTGCHQRLPRTYLAGQGGAGSVHSAGQRARLVLISPAYGQRFAIGEMNDKLAILTLDTLDSIPGYPM